MFDGSYCVVFIWRYIGKTPMNVEEIMDSFESIEIGLNSMEPLEALSELLV